MKTSYEIKPYCPATKSTPASYKLVATDETILVVISKPPGHDDWHVTVPDTGEAKVVNSFDTAREAKSWTLANVDAIKRYRARLVA